MKRITRRWLLNSFGVIVVVLAVLVVAGSFAVREYYYNLVDEEEVLTGTASGSSGQTIAD